MDIDSLFAQLHSLPSIPKVAQELIQQFDTPLPAWKAWRAISNVTR